MIELCKESGQEEEYAHPWRNAVFVATIENLRGGASSPLFAGELAIFLSRRACQPYAYDVP
mgnify:FL=1